MPLLPFLVRSSENRGAMSLEETAVMSMSDPAESQQLPKQTQTRSPATPLPGTGSISPIAFPCQRFHRRR